MAKKKAEAIAKREEEMRLAAQGAKQNYDMAKQTRQQHTYESIMGVPGATPYNFDHR